MIITKRPKNNKKYLLNTLGLVDSSVLVFSPYKKIVKSFNGVALKITRSSDSASQNFYFLGNGLIDQVGIQAFVGSGDGYIDEVYLQTLGVKAYNSGLNSTKPRIIVSGVWQDRGLLFDGSNDFMNIEAINKQIHSTYLSTKLTTSINSGSDAIVYLWTSGYSELSIGARTGLLTNEIVTIYNDANMRAGWCDAVASLDNTTQHKILTTWNGSAWSMNITGSEKTLSLNDVQTYQYIGNTNQIGARTTAYYYKGNIKYLLCFNSNVKSYQQQLFDNL